MVGNILIMVLVVTDRHLHIPMYFLQGNLYCLETCYTSTILPRMLASLLTGDRTISMSGCITQFYFFSSLAGTECLLLSVMSYDRDPKLMEMLSLTLSFPFLLVPFLLTMMSYISIITTILRIPSTTGRQKAFSTCSSHLIVASIYYGTLLLVYMFPTAHALSDFKKVLSVVYTVLTPLVNPLIYTLRNKELGKLRQNEVQLPVQSRSAGPKRPTHNNHNEYPHTDCH
ncbi:olfactory receptor 11A1-like [Emydura macquarii macquarii]|uniref:olfactory receptor 11A1-like n=1 Tax=Emydura macquarii macquarii TaxID=1129001 RepID=UPI00352B4A94